MCTGKLTKKANFLECVDTYNFRPGDLLQHNMNCGAHEGNQKTASSDCFSLEIDI